MLGGIALAMGTRQRRHQDRSEALVSIVDHRYLANVLTGSVIGGASAGGHLAATMINMLTDVPTAPKDLKFKLCLSIVPVTDNTAGEPHLGSPTWNNYESWTTNADGPSDCYPAYSLPRLTLGLEKSKMLWYRNLFLPNIEHRVSSKHDSYVG